jgi:hypothetical protein
MAKKKTTTSSGIKTRLAKISLKPDTDVGAVLQAKCDNMGNLGYRLSATFTHVNLLILIFQK